MKFFIDTANIEQIRMAQSLGILDGVTTNPSLMAKEGIKGKENICNHYKTICDIVDGPVSAEVLSTDYEGMIKEGEELYQIDSQKITIKLPCTSEGIKAVKYFADKGYRTNCTLVFTVGQALLAAKAGATYCSPFIGRLDDIGEDGIELIRQIVRMYSHYGFTTKVLAASIRHTNHILRAMQAGAHVATSPYKFIVELVNHPLTTKGLEIFCKAAEEMK